MDPQRDTTDDPGGPSATASMAATVSDPVFGVDLDGMVELWNGPAERLWRLTASEAVGSKLPHLAPSRRRRFLTAVRRAAATMERTEIVESTRREGEVPLTCSFTLIPLPADVDGTGHVLAVVGSAEVRWRVEELVSIVPGLISERLRTPLSAVLGYAQLLARPGSAGDRAKSRRVALAMAERGDEVMDVLEDLAVLERIVVGRPALETRRVDLARLVAETVGAAETAVPGCRIVAEIDTRVGGVDVDPRVLRHVIDSALIRAARDCPDGVGLRVSLTQRTESATLSMHATARATPGTSGSPATDLGSVVLARVAQAHGGSAEERRLPDGGRTTILRLPLRTED